MTDLKVEIRITEEASEPYVIIYTNEMTEGIAQIVFGKIEISQCGS